MNGIESLNKFLPLVLALTAVASASTSIAAQSTSALQVVSNAGSIPAGFETVFTGALVSTYADGRTAHLWLSADGGFTARGRNGGHNAGRWTLSGQRVCMRQTRPIPLPFHYCTPLPANLKEPWSAKAPTGDTVTLRFAAGDRP